MKRRIARHKRTLALLLTLCLLLTCLPLQAMSAGGTAEETDISNEVYIVDEDITKRGEYEKHFLCSDGTYRAVTYAEPVHYYDSSTGTWQDNDVALTLNAASTRYEAQSGSFAVSFAKSYAAPALSAAANGTTQSQATQTAQTVTMSNGIYPISWTTAVKPELSVAEGTAIQKSAALGAPRLLTRTPAASILTSAEAEAAQSFAGKPISDSGSFAAANRISVAEYGNIAQTAGQSAGVSLRYSVSQHKIKEDIVISNKSAVTDFVTTLDVGALTAVKQEDGSVLLVDEYGDTAYTVGVPFMYDADYNVSYNVAVTVGQTGSVCRITYAPDREWLNAAVYPVVLDPTVTSSEYYANIVDTYVTQADSNNHSGEGNLVVGIKNGKLNRAYLRINNLPAIPAGVTPASAQLLIKHGANTTSGRAMTLYRVNSSWSPGSITYSNQPSASTSIGSCAFNTSNVRFTFSQSQIQDLYTRVSNNTNYGFQIRYTSESTTNPDYNMLRSMEYPTASEQPAFTVTYAYTLPESLSVGEIYLFRNAGSGKYMDVQNGTDANDTNVIQWGWNGSLAQQFKLEQSSTGNGYILRSQVGGKTRVLDIYKTNGRVENGNNVQIYRNVDPIAQEWLIIPVDNMYYKIVPRSNPALALTSYGSSNGSATGKSTTSAGNVFVSTYTGNNRNQWWRIERENGVFMDPGAKPIEDGEYYLNNSISSMYLKKSSSNAISAGTMDDASASCRWKFTYYAGRYFIQPANNLNQYLSSGGSTIDTTVTLTTVGNIIPDTVLWTVTRDFDSNELTIQNHLSRRLSNISGDDISAEIVYTADDTWRFVEKDDYTPMPDSFGLNASIVYMNETQLLSVTNVSGVSFAEPDDFLCEVTDAYPAMDVVSLRNSSQGIYVTGKRVGRATIKITHRPSAKTSSFEIRVNKLQEEFEPNGPDDYVEAKLTKRDGRFFYFPDPSIASTQYESDIEEQLKYILPDGTSYEKLSGFCQYVDDVVLPDGVLDLSVNHKAYIDSNDYGISNVHRPILELLRRTKYSVLYTHGQSDSILLSALTPVANQLLLTSEDLADESIPSGYLKNCELIVILACKAGGNTSDGEGLDNIVDSLYILGAKNVIGFTSNITPKQAWCFFATLTNFMNCTGETITLWDPTLGGPVENVPLEAEDISTEKRSIYKAYQLTKQYVPEFAGIAYIQCDEMH